MATPLHNLAAVYQYQARYEEAERLHKKALEIQEKAFGPDHPHVAVSLNNLAAVYRKTDREAEAGKLEARARAIETTNR